MSASATDPSSSSISSTGHIDGLGRRSLSFDRETGEMLERVHVRPELVAFETLIRERVARLVTFDDDRFARPARVERDPATGELTVLAEFITGSRLSDLFEATADAAIVPGVDVALGYLLESLPALTLLHTLGGMTHGLIDASRTVLTPDGQVVFLDPSFGSAVEALSLSRPRLWAGFGIASPSGAGAVRFDAASDIAQVALGAVALVLGRNLRPDEYPDALPTLLMEVIEVAQIRGSSGFATGLQRFLQRSLPLPGRRPYVTADEAAADVRQLVRREIGVDVCRLAVVDFAAQMDAAFFSASGDDDAAGERAEEHYGRPATGNHSPRVPELDQFLDRFEHPAAVDAPSPDPESDPSSLDATDDDSDETEISLDLLEPEVRVAPERGEEIYDLPPLDEVMAEANMLSPVPHAPRASYTYSEPDPPASETASGFSDGIQSDTDYFPVEVVEEVDVPDTPEEPVALVAAEPEIERPAAVTYDAPVEPIAARPEALAPPPVMAVEPPAEAPAVEPETDSDQESAPSRRRKRQQQKSARARKDKLRSSTSGPKPPPPPVPPPEPARPASGWLVSPQRSSQFEAPAPSSLPVPAPQPIRPVAPPPMPSFVPTPVGPLPQPVYPSGSSGAYGTPSSPPAPRPGPLAPPPQIQPASQPTAQVKLRVEPPSGFTPRKSMHPEPPPIDIPPDRFGTLGLGRGGAAVDEPRAFPAKLAAIAVGVAIIAVIVGRTYLPGRTAVTGEPGAQVEAPATTPSSAPTPPPAATSDSAIPSGRGRLVVQTQPPGIKVLLDRKPVGETPLRIDVPAGRRILTFLTSGGEVLRSVRVVAGKTETLDIPVFSGWVAIFAPIVLQVSADGKSLGTTEQNRLMLAPGKHLLTLTNKELAYSSSQQVEIDPGEVTSINIEPRGTVSLNAVPWAEVWLDGKKLGDTPLAATPVPLGLREFVFKNPQRGERKVSATIKAGSTSLVTVDFSK